MSCMLYITNYIYTSQEEMKTADKNNRFPLNFVLSWGAREKFSLTLRGFIAVKTFVSFDKCIIIWGEVVFYLKGSIFAYCLYVSERKERLHVHSLTVQVLKKMKRQKISQI